jgi:hypothetical protein
MPTGSLNFGLPPASAASVLTTSIGAVLLRTLAFATIDAKTGVGGVASLTRTLQPATLVATVSAGPQLANTDRQPMVLI